MNNFLFMLLPVILLISADRPVKDAYILSRNYEVTIGDAGGPGNHDTF